MDYKQSLKLPQTSFAMRADLAVNEPLRYASWRQKGVYQKMLRLRTSAAASFNIHDGPPYANGHIHIGHALNKILKDIITKTHYFFGEAVHYTPGWDCHGLPIEQQVENKLGDAKKSFSKNQIREECRKWAEEFIAIQGGEFEALGVVGDFDNPYKTLKPHFEADIYKTLCEVAKKGLLVERSKPVFWSWAAKSALAEAEIEYEDKEDYSLYIAFDLSASGCEKLGLGEAKMVIWTTMSWTLPANVGISINPNEKYALTSENFIIASPLVESCVAVGFTKGEVVREFDASELEGLVAINPLNGRDSVVMLGEHVLMDGGTGLVHTAPGHGEDDYFVSLKYGMKTIMCVGEDGCFEEGVRNFVPSEFGDEFVGLHIFKANERILQILKARGDSLLSATRFTHSYPFCWRTHKPVIYRATKQWFIAMDEPVLEGKTLREVALSEIEKVKFYPPNAKNRLTSMVSNRPDWCISRQRDWGVPIAFFRDKKSKEVLFDSEILDFVASVFEKRGADAWWEMSVEELLPQSHKHLAAGLEKCEGILDVWFDSGSTWNAVLKSGEYDAGGVPASMYLEGSDQHRGWFQSSLLVACAVMGQAPFKAILTHGFTTDKNGNKMSKSKGNVVAPQEVAKKFGVEILRLWVATGDYSGEQKIGDEILKQVAEQYRKIRNTIRFMLSCVDDFKAAETNGGFSGLDAWILTRAKRVFDEVEAAFRAYEFSRGYQQLLTFLGGELSGIYLDICKDRLYCESEHSPLRLDTQRVILKLLKGLLALLAPVLTYTIDEALDAASESLKAGAEDVFDLVYQPLEFSVKSSWSEVQTAALEELKGSFNEVIDSLKKDKIIKNTLELSLNGEFDGLSEAAAEWFMVSEVTPNGGGEVLATLKSELFGEVVLRKTTMFKCPRCWKFNAASEESLCPRCQKVLEN